MKLSIIATLYQSAPYITEFYNRATASAKAFAGDDYEIVLVNDGSPDSSLCLAIELTKADTHVVVVDLSRNFGHHRAMMTGLANAVGDKLFLIDSDLEEDPEYLNSFAKVMALERCDVVYGVQEQRKGDWFEKLSGRIFWNLINALSGLPLPPNVVTARLMTRRYVNALLQHKEREVFMAGLWFITGFEQKPQAVKKSSHSKSTYTFRRKISLFVNSVTSFSNAPLIAIFYIGVIIFLLAFLYTAYIIVNWFFFSYPLRGWTSMMASIWLLGGLIISFIGINGIYLSKIFSESKNRPYTIIRDIYGRN